MVYLGEVKNETTLASGLHQKSYMGRFLGIFRALVVLQRFRWRQHDHFAHVVITCSLLNHFFAPSPSFPLDVLWQASVWNSPLRLSVWWCLVASSPSALTSRSLSLTRHLLHAHTHLLAMMGLMKFSFRENYPEINLLRFSRTRELWSSKAHLRFRTLFAAVSQLCGPLRKKNLT